MNCTKNTWFAASLCFLALAANAQSSSEPTAVAVLPTVSRSVSNSLNATRTVTGGCTMSFDDNGPVYTSGTTIIPAHGTLPVQTVPCEKFLWVIYWDASSEGLITKTGSTNSATITPTTSASATSSQTSISSASSEECYVAGIRQTLSTANGQATITYQSGDFIWTGTNEWDRWTATGPVTETVPCYTPPPVTTTYYTPGSYGTFPITVPSGGLLPSGPMNAIATKQEVINLPCAVDGDPAYHFRNNTPNSAFTSSFRRSDQCTSILDEQEKDPHLCIPPGVNVAMGAVTTWGCCGMCSIQASKASILHWATAVAPDCSGGNSTITSKMRRREESATAGGPESYAVVSGKTLTYPSLYIAFQGSVFVADNCGIRGKVYIDPTIPIPAGGLSTLSYSSYPFVDDDNGRPGVKSASYDFDVCPTYGMAEPTWSTWEYTFGPGNTTLTSSEYFSIGAPYHPIVSIPRELYDWDPEWANCKWFTSLEGIQLGVFDPPTALTAQAALAPASTEGGGHDSGPVTKTNVEPVQSASPAPTLWNPQPQSTVSDSLPPKDTGLGSPPETDPHPHGDPPKTDDPPKNNDTPKNDDPPKNDNPPKNGSPPKNENPSKNGDSSESNDPPKNDEPPKNGSPPNSSDPSEDGDAPQNDDPPSSEPASSKPASSYPTSNNQPLGRPPTQDEPASDPPKTPSLGNIIAGALGMPENPSDSSGSSAGNTGVSSDPDAPPVNGDSNTLPDPSDHPGTPGTPGSADPADPPSPSGPSDPSKPSKLPDPSNRPNPSSQSNPFDPSSPSSPSGSSDPANPAPPPGSSDPSDPSSPSNAQKNPSNNPLASLSIPAITILPSGSGVVIASPGSDGTDGYTVSIARGSVVTGATGVEVIGPSTTVQLGSFVTVGTVGFGAGSGGVGGGGGGESTGSEMGISIGDSGSYGDGAGETGGSGVGSGSNGRPDGGSISATVTATGVASESNSVSGTEGTQSGNGAGAESTVAVGGQEGLGVEWSLLGGVVMLGMAWTW